MIWNADGQTTATHEKLYTKILLVDETLGTYKYRLMTCLVVYDNSRGWPVAHLISSPFDSANSKFFFGILTTRQECQNINCVITVDDSANINGMNKGFLNELRHTLCIRHLIKMWKII